MLWFWSIVAIICLWIEIYGSGFGFIFLTIGATIITALLGTQTISVDNLLLQWLIFIAFVVIFAVFFLYSYHKQRTPDLFQENRLAVVEQDIGPQHEGTVRWSGTVVKARLEEKQQTACRAGQQVKILEFQGNIAIIVSVESINIPNES